MPSCSTGTTVSARRAQPGLGLQAGMRAGLGGVERLAAPQRIGARRPHHLGRVQRVLVDPAGREQQEAVAVHGEDRSAPPLDQREDDVDRALAQPARIVRADDEVRELVDQIRSARHRYLRALVRGFKLAERGGFEPPVAGISP